MTTGNDALQTNIENLLAGAADTMAAAAQGETPYQMIGNLAEAFHHVGNRLYGLIVAHHGGDSKGIACHSGCNVCCHLNSTVQTGRKAHAVAMTLFDGVVLLEHLVNIRQTPQGLQIIENTEAMWRKLPTTLNRLPCPFDVAGNCAVYVARPMVCRLYFSSNATHCAIQADVPANERQVDTPIARALRPYRQRLTAHAAEVLTKVLPGATFGYFDFMTTAHRLVTAVKTEQEDELRASINNNLSF